MSTSFENYPNLSLWFAARCKKEGNRTICFSDEAGRRGEISYTPHSWIELDRMIEAIAGHLVRCGIEAGHRVGILSATRMEWMICDLAILRVGAITVSFYHTSSPDELCILLEDAQLNCLFIEGKLQLNKIKKFISKDLPIVAFDGDCPTEEFLNYTTLSNVLKIDLTTEESGLIQKRQAATNEDDAAAIVYTSGTSGESKGVILTHGNFLAQLDAVSERLTISTQDNRFLCFLTAAHIFQRVAGQWLFLKIGCPIYFCQRLERLGDYIKTSKATIMLSVPLVLERMMSKFNKATAELPTIQKHIVSILFKLGTELKLRELTATASILRNVFELLWKLLYKAFFSRFRSLVAGDIQLIISGGAPLNSDVQMFFETIGIRIAEGYGLTENTAVISVNHINNPVLKSVGKILKGIELRIADDDELQVKGDVVFGGYWRRPEQTKEAFTEDGWFKTGDLGKLDEYGNLYITGRKKDLIINAGGKKISPIMIEEAIKASDLIDQIAVLGDGQKWLGALIVLNRNAVSAKLNLNVDNWNATIEDPSVIKLVREDLERHSARFAEYEKIRNFVLLTDPFTQEKGELTHTLKLKRSVIKQNYRSQIQAMFGINS